VYICKVPKATASKVVDCRDVAHVFLNGLRRVYYVVDVTGAIPMRL